MYIANDKRYDNMIFNRCGNSGLMLPAVSLGFWHNFGDADNYDNMRALCTTAFDNGITQFDLANNYGPAPGAAEENLGKILKDCFMPYRDELIITTKAGYGMWPGPYGDNGSRKYLLASLDASLKRMGLDYVDIFYHHRPDYDTPLEETMGALAQAVRSGKALYVGLSNYDGARMEQATKILEELKVPFVINQNSYNIFNREIEHNGIKEGSNRLGKGIISFCPLAQGLLTNRYIDGIPKDSRIGRGSMFLPKEAVNDDYVSKVVKLNEIAQQRGQTLAEMALAWVLKDNEITSVLIGASKTSQIIDNIGALKNTNFTAEELKAIDEASL